MLIAVLVQKTTAAGTVAFTAPVSGEIRAIQSAMTGFLSSDPSLSNTELGTPSADGIKTNVIALVVSSGQQKFDLKNAPVVSAGESLYFAATGKGSCCIYFDDLQSS
jgi:hypothetical protein